MRLGRGCREDECAEGGGAGRMNVLREVVEGG